MTIKYLVYVRRSTADQEDEHQFDDIREWLADRDIGLADVEILSEQASGASSTRDQFGEMIDRVESGDITDVVVWEISRIARKGVLAQEFFDACERGDVTVHVTNGSISEIKPDGTNRLIADIIASVAAEERRSLIRRTRSGVSRAQRAGKWTGSPPAGFSVVDGFLRPIVDPNEDEISFLELQTALERVEAGESQRSVAAPLPISRTALSKIYNDEERKAWYIDGSADDDRIQSALDDIPHFESPPPEEAMAMNSSADEL